MIAPGTQWDSGFRVLGQNQMVKLIQLIGFNQKQWWYHEDIEKWNLMEYQWDIFWHIEKTLAAISHMVRIRESPNNSLI